MPPIDLPRSVGSRVDSSVMGKLGVVDMMVMVMGSSRCLLNGAGGRKGEGRGQRAEGRGQRAKLLYGNKGPVISWF